MPDGGRHDGASAGALPSTEVDPVELYERLREEIRRGGADGAGARTTWRAQAERMWPVSAERPLVRRPGLKGAIAYPVKRLLRPLLRWYVEPLAAEQRAYNDALLKLVDNLYETADRSASGADEARRALVELEERLRRVERREPGQGPAPVQTVAAQPAAAAIPDYFAFEARMRGSTGACIWFNGDMIAADLGDEESDLPEGLYNRLEGGGEYVNHRTFASLPEAERAIQAAWVKARKAGWKPNG